MDKKFTKSQFSAVSNELVKLAKEFTSKGFDSSVSLPRKVLQSLYTMPTDAFVCLLSLKRDLYV